MQSLRAEVVALHAQGLSHPEIAQRLGMPRRRVDALLRRRPTFAPRTCELCGQPFTPASGRQRFCTPEHRRLHAAPRTVREARERVQALEAEIARVRAQLAEAA